MWGVQKQCAKVTAKKENEKKKGGKGCHNRKMLLGDVAAAMWLEQDRQICAEDTAVLPGLWTSCPGTHLRGMLRTRATGWEPEPPGDRAEGSPDPTSYFYPAFPTHQIFAARRGDRKVPSELSRARRDTLSPPWERGARKSNTDPGRAVASGPHSARPDRSVWQQKEAIT